MVRASTRGPCQDQLRHKGDASFYGSGSPHVTPTRPWHATSGSFVCRLHVEEGAIQNNPGNALFALLMPNHVRSQPDEIHLNVHYTFVRVLIFRDKLPLLHIATLSWSHVS